MLLANLKATTILICFEFDIILRTIIVTMALVVRRFIVKLNSVSDHGHVNDMIMIDIQR